MKQTLALVIAFCITFGPFAGITPRANAESPVSGSAAAVQDSPDYQNDQDYPDDQDGVSFSGEQLENLLAPIALYPDPLLAQVLLAATFPCFSLLDPLAQKPCEFRPIRSIEIGAAACFYLWLIKFNWTINEAIAVQPFEERL